MYVTRQSEREMNMLYMLLLSRGLHYFSVAMFAYQRGGEVYSLSISLNIRTGLLQDPVTWYWINYTGTQITQWDFHNKGILTSPARLSFVLKVPLRQLRSSVIYSVPSDRILQRACFLS